MAPVYATFDQWWNGISLRAKVTGVTVLLLTFGLVVAGAGTMTVLRTYLLERVDTEIKSLYEIVPRQINDFELIENFAAVDSGNTPFYVAAVSADGVLLQDNLPNAQTELRPDVRQLTLSTVVDLRSGITLSNEAKTAEWRVFVAPLRVNVGSQQATLVIGLSLAETNAIIARFTVIFFGFALAVIVFGGATTQLLVTSTFAPLRDVEATAARFAAGDYSQRLGGATPNTEVGRLNRSLNTMLARIDRAFADRQRTVEQMRRFVGDASHELRTPLVSLRGYAELYRMGAIQKPEDVAQAMDRIEREAIRMGALVEDLLELARLDEAREPELAPVDLLPIANDAALDASASAPKREVRVIVDGTGLVAAPPPAPLEEAPAPPRGGKGDRGGRRGSGINTGPIPLAATIARLRRRRNRGSQPADASSRAAETVSAGAGAADGDRPPEEHGPVVLGDENKIRQVLTNLIGNAMRFTPDDSPIEIVVGVDKAGGYGQLSIVDHGEGIPPQLREKIFQRFWRADTSRARETGGSGLGLAIVAGIVANHKGHIEVVETPGGGATFRVSLPLVPTTPEPPSSTDDEPAPGPEAPSA